MPGATTAPYVLYRAVTAAASLVAPLWLRARARCGKEEPQRLRERYGHGRRARPAGTLIWCHGASVGESLAMLALITRLLEPADRHVLMTTGTVSSALLMAQRLPPRALHSYIPLDHRPWARRFLDHWHPDLVLWAESELWPNLLAEIARQERPAVLVNGRLSDRAFRGWRRCPSFARCVLAPFHLVLAQSAEDAARFAGLGAKEVRVAGNLKLALPPLPADAPAQTALAAMVGRRPTWLAASIHPGEDRVVADVHKALRERDPELLTLVVPRHPPGATEMAEGFAAAGLACARRSRGEPVTEATDVYIGDTIGELGLFYRAAPIAFIGKSLAVGGGQNPAEAAQLDCATIVGPDMSNFRDLTAGLLAAGGAIQIASGAELAAAVGRLLAIPEERARMAASGRAFMATHGEALLVTLAALAPWLDVDRSCPKPP